MVISTHNKVLFKLSIIALIAIFVTTNTSAQCPVKAKANVLTILCGDTVKLSAISSAGDYLIKCNFDTAGVNQPGTNWAQTPSGTYTRPCGAAKSGLATDFYLWLGSSATVPRSLASVPFNLTTGGYISFDMRYAAEGEGGVDAAPCEGVDAPLEGVYLQYSIDGTNWVSIDYFTPNGGNDAFRTTWNNYAYTIPAAACTPTTRIRWFQDAANDAGTDHWGLDNIMIVRNDPAFKFDWLHDPQPPNTTGATPPVVPYSDTTYTVVLSNQTTGVNCTSSVDIKTVKPTGTISASPTQVCPNGSSQLNVNAVFTPPSPSSCGISGSGCVGNSATVNLVGTIIAEPTLGGYSTLGRNQSNGGVTFCGCSLPEGTGTCDNSGRTQMIIQASEMPAFFKGGQISKVTFNVTGANKDYNRFTIQMGCTPKTEFASNTDFITGLVTVFTPQTVNIRAGANTFEFNYAFDWDGVSNIVIQTSWVAEGANNYSTGNMQKQATTTYATINAYSCATRGETETGGATRFLSRPNMILDICYRPIPVLSYSWKNSAGTTTGLNNATIKNPMATVPFPGDKYTVFVSDATKPIQCGLTKDVEVKALGPDVSINPSPSAFVCASGGSVSLTASATPSVPGGTITSYTWSPTTGLSSPNSAATNASPTVTTVYTVTATEAAGCSNTATVTVFVNPATTPPTANNGPLCAGSTLNLSTTLTGAVYNWTGPNGFTSNQQNPTLTNITPAQAGNYSLSVTVGGCPSGTPGVTNVVVKANDNANFSYGTGTFCRNPGTFSPTPTLAAGVTGTFSGSPGLIINTSTGVVDLGTPLGNYTVTFVSNGSSTTCTATTSLPITIANGFDASFSYSTPVCQGPGTLSPIFTTGSAGQFTFSPAGLVINTSSGVVNLSTSTPNTTYTITNTIPAAGGCPADTKNSTLTINGTPVATFTGIDPAGYCVNNTTGITLTPTGTAGGTFSGPGVTGSTFRPSAAGVGTHDITYTVGNATCSDVTTQKVTVNALPTLPVIGGDTLICKGEGTLLSVPNTYDSYAWSPGTSTKSSTLVTDTVTTIYTVTVTKNGCSISKQQQVVVRTATSAKITANKDSVCRGDLVTLSVPPGADGYSWTPNGETSNAINFYPNQTATYTVSVFTGECFATSSKRIVVNNVPTVTMGALSPICKNVAPFALYGGNPSGGVYSGTGVGNNQFDPAVTGPGTVNINYTYTDKKGCRNTATSQLLVNDAPNTPVPNKPFPICENGSVTLRSNINSSIQVDKYEWRKAPDTTVVATTKDLAFSPVLLKDTGNYNVVIIIDGCSSGPGFTSIAVNPLPIFDINPVTPITVCAGTPITLVARDRFNQPLRSKTWSANTSEVLVDKDSTLIRVVPQATTRYTFSGTTIYRCSSVASKVITVNQFPTPSIAAPDTVCADEQFSLVGNGGVNLTWMPGNLFSTPNNPTQFLSLPNPGSSVEVSMSINSNNCIDTARKTIHVKDCNLRPDLLPPTAFTPDGKGDATYETFRPYNNNLATYKLTIYNRWGERIFQSTDPNIGWDGTFHGQAAPNGVYVYIVEGRGLNGQYIVHPPDMITLIR